MNEKCTLVHQDSGVTMMEACIEDIDILGKEFVTGNFYPLCDDMMIGLTKKDPYISDGRYKLMDGLDIMARDLYILEFNMTVELGGIATTRIKFGIGRAKTYLVDILYDEDGH